MAYYNPYYPTNLPTQGFNQPSNYNATQNYIPTPQIPEQQQENGILWVQGEAGAKSFAVAPGRSVMLMDSEQDRFYIKTADAIIDVPRGCCFNLAVENASTIPINVQNSNLVVNRIA